jgi:site-specific DNA-methyltransferase (adenine-specific)
MALRSMPYAMPSGVTRAGNRLRRSVSLSILLDHIAPMEICDEKPEVRFGLFENVRVLKMLMRTEQCDFQRNVAQCGDALALLRSLPRVCGALMFFDPQHRSVLDHLKFGNEDSRQRGRAALPAMAEETIDAILIEGTGVLKPGGYLMLWADTFRICQAHHLRVAHALQTVDLISWDSERMGMGKRSRRRGDYLLILQKPPVSARSWKDHSLTNRWAEKVDRKIHPHIKPIELTRRLIAAVTEPGDLVVDPAAGSFIVMRAAHALGRDFAGCDIAYDSAESRFSTDLFAWEKYRCGSEAPFAAREGEP